MKPFWRPVSLPAVLRKLFQEPHVVLKEHLNVVDAVLQHRQTIHAHSEREATHFFRVVFHKAIHRGIDHPRAKQFNPTRTFALAASRARRAAAAAAAENAGHVEFDRWFGKRKIARTKTRFHAGPEILFDEILDRAREIAERNVRV